MSNNPVAAHEDIPVNEPAIPLKNGPVILPKTRLSLWSAVLTLAGALSFFFNWIIAVILNQSIGHFLWLLEVALFIIMAIILFVSRKTGKSLLIPLLIWSIGAMFEVIIYASVTFMQVYESLLYPIISTTLALTLIAVIFFTILFVLRVINKQKIIIVIGILFAIFLSSGIFINIHDLFLSLNSDYPHIGFTLRYLLMSLYYLTISLGIFLTILAAKEKQAVPIIDEPAEK